MDGVVMVDSCLRDGLGGSPTAVVPDGDGLSERDLMRVPGRTGASHVAVVTAGPGEDRTVRFFTSAGELPGCGHGTVAVITALALHGAEGGFAGRLRIAGRSVEASGAVTTGADGGIVTAWFDQGLVVRRDATDPELDAFLDALGLDRSALPADRAVAVASPGRERLLLPVTDVAVLTGLRPDPERLAAVSHRFGQLGCFVYVPPSGARRAVARMFAPAIGVPEDVANANSTGCLAAVLLMDGHDPVVTVDQGDALGCPSTVCATAERVARGVGARVGGTARLRSG